MSFKERLTRYGSPSDEAETRLYIYWHNPSTIDSTDRIISNDKSAAQNISELQAIIADLQEYRQALAARYGQLETMPYKRELLIERHPAWGSHGTTYDITITRIMEDGTKQEELREHYTGKDRSAALKRFDELKKQNPGIKATKDIEKRQWEH
jgi:hypothetical protein